MPKLPVVSRKETVHKTLKKGTLANGILKSINLPVDEFKKLLK